MKLIVLQHISGEKEACSTMCVMVDCIVFSLKPFWPCYTALLSKEEMDGKADKRWEYRWHKTKAKRKRKQWFQQFTRLEREHPTANEKMDAFHQLTFWRRRKWWDTQCITYKVFVCNKPFHIAKHIMGLGTVYICAAPNSSGFVYAVAD